MITVTGSLAFDYIKTKIFNKYEVRGLHIAQFIENGMEPCLADYEARRAAGLTR